MTESFAGHHGIDVLNPGFQLAPDLHFQPNVNPGYIKILLESIIHSLQESYSKQESQAHLIDTLSTLLDTRCHELQTLIQTNMSDFTSASGRKITELEHAITSRDATLERQSAHLISEVDKRLASAAASTRHDIEAVRHTVSDSERRVGDDVRALARRCLTLEGSLESHATVADVDRVATHVDALGHRLGEVAATAAAAVGAAQKLQESVRDAATAMASRASAVEEGCGTSLRNLKTQVDTAIEACDSRTASTAASLRSELDEAVEVIKRRAQRLGEDVDAAVKGAADAAATLSADMTNRLAALSTEISSLAAAQSRDIASVKTLLESETAARGASITSLAERVKEAVVGVENNIDSLRQKMAESQRTSSATLTQEVDGLKEDLRGASRELQAAAVESARGIEKKISDVSARIDTVGRHVNDVDTAVQGMIGLRQDVPALRHDVGVLKSELGVLSGSLAENFLRLERNTEIAAEALERKLVSTTHLLKSDLLSIGNKAESELQGVESRLEGSVSGLEQRLSQELHALESRCNSRIDAEISDMGAIESRMDQHVASVASQTERVMQRIEGLGRDVQGNMRESLAEATARVDRTSTELNKRFEDLSTKVHAATSEMDDRLNRHIENSDSRISGHEMRQTAAHNAVLDRVEGLRCTVSQATEGLADCRSSSAATAQQVATLEREVKASIRGTGEETLASANSKMSSAVSSITGSVSTLEDSTDTRFKEVNNTIARLRSEVQNVSALNLELRPWAAPIESVQSALRRLEDRTAEIQQSSSTAATDASRGISELRLWTVDRLADLQQNATASKHVACSEAIERAEAAMKSKLDGKIAEIQGKVDSIQHKVDSTQSKVDNCHRLVGDDGLAADISTLTSRISTVQKQFEELQKLHIAVGNGSGDSEGRIVDAAASAAIGQLIQDVGSTASLSGRALTSALLNALTPSVDRIAREAADAAAEAAACRAACDALSADERVLRIDGISRNTDDIHAHVTQLEDVVVRHSGALESVRNAVEECLTRTTELFLRSNSLTAQLEGSVERKGASSARTTVVDDHAEESKLSLKIIDVHNLAASAAAAAADALSRISTAEHTSERALALAEGSVGRGSPPEEPLTIRRVGAISEIQRGLIERVDTMERTCQGIDAVLTEIPQAMSRMDQRIIEARHLFDNRLSEFSDGISSLKRRIAFLEAEHERLSNSATDMLLSQHKVDELSKKMEGFVSSNSELRTLCAELAASHSGEMSGFVHNFSASLGKLEDRIADELATHRTRTEASCRAAAEAVIAKQSSTIDNLEKVLGENRERIAVLESRVSTFLDAPSRRDDELYSNGVLPVRDGASPTLRAELQALSSDLQLTGDSIAVIRSEVQDIQRQIKNSSDGAANADEVEVCLGLVMLTGIHPASIKTAASLSSSDRYELLLSSPPLASLASSIAALKNRLELLETNVASHSDDSEVISALGIEVIQMSQSRSTALGPVRVVGLRENGPAHFAGVLLADSILAVNGYDVSTIADLVSAMAIASHRVLLDVGRIDPDHADGRRLSMTVSIGAHAGNSPPAAQQSTRSLRAVLTPASRDAATRARRPMPGMDVGSENSTS